MSKTKDTVIDNLNATNGKYLLNVYFKIRISSNEEREKVISHLQQVGFYCPTDDIDRPAVIGILVGNVYVAEIHFQHFFVNCPHQEYTVEEVLKMNFKEPIEKP